MQETKRECYSQNNEQDVILNYINQLGISNGKFMDIGAFHPKVFSNTRALYEDGWDGVIIEPSPICFSEFKREYELDPRMTLLNLAVSETIGNIDFYESNGDAISTTEIAHKEKWEQNEGIKYNKIQVPTISVSELMETHGMDIDFISIDVESKNLELFDLLLPYFHTNPIKIVCIEHDNNIEHMISQMNECDFRCVLQNNENLIFVRK